MTAAKPLDMKLLYQLTDGDAGLMLLSVRTFTDSAEECLSLLKDAQDAIGFQRVAHRLKGASRSVGAVQLAELAWLAEQAKDSPAGPIALGLVNEIEAAVGLVHLAVEDNFAASQPHAG